WIIVAAVVVFGASKLPEIARNLGRSSGEFKKGLKEGDEPRTTSATDAPMAAPPSAASEPPRDQARTDPAP
ncbi:MAG TPA: twin-arginine translocase TatA/TatE family subunit, partial [Actinomycetota bacterium]